MHEIFNSDLTMVIALTATKNEMLVLEALSL